MDPQVRRWLIALVIGIALFAIGVAQLYRIRPAVRACAAMSKHRKNFTPS
jgi:hypothetical protein